MNALVDEKSLSEIVKLVENKYGLSFTDSHLPMLKNRLSMILSELSLNSLEELKANIGHHSSSVFSRIVDVFTINETYFFRNRAHFEALRHNVLPMLERALGPCAPLIIWSAGCSSGEEAYSLAMWIKEFASGFWPHRLRIIATDISGSSLQKARLGKYSKNSFRQVDPVWIRRYFKQQGNEYYIDESLKNVITFCEHNLASKCLPKEIIASTVSLILCRNVLIYFSLPNFSRALELFKSSLGPFGFLILGHAESFHALRGWQVEYFSGTYFYRPPKEKNTITPKNPTGNYQAIRTSLPPSSAPVAEPSPRPVPPVTTPSDAQSPRDPNHLSDRARRSHWNHRCEARRAPPGGVPPTSDKACDFNDKSSGGRKMVRISGLQFSSDLSSARTPMLCEQNGNERGIPSASQPSSLTELLDTARYSADAGELSKARQLLRQVTDRDKTSIEGYFLSALVEEQLGEWEEAEKSLKKAVFLDNQLVLGHYFIALLHERKKEREAALRRYRTVLNILHGQKDDAKVLYGSWLSVRYLREMVEVRIRELFDELQSPEARK